MEQVLKKGLIGIYKITSPTGKVYIGQSICIRKRFLNYKNYFCKEQPKLYNSLRKYGFEAHIFEVVEETLFEFLNERERYWQDYYSVTGPQGLNLILTKTDVLPQKVSEETKLKISAALRGDKHPWFGKKHSESSKIKMKGVLRWVVEDHPMKGKQHTKETKEKQSLARKNRFVGENSPLFKVAKTEQHRKNMSKAKKEFFANGGVHSWTGKTHSENSRLKMSLSKKGITTTSSAKMVLNVETGVFYDNIKLAAEAHNISYDILAWRLRNFPRIKSVIVYCN